MGPVLYDNNKLLIPLTVITLSTTHSVLKSLISVTKQFWIFSFYLNSSTQNDTKLYSDPYIVLH